MASTHDATFVCITEKELPRLDGNRQLYAGLCLASAFLGFIGAAWQLRKYGRTVLCRNQNIQSMDSNSGMFAVRGGGPSRGSVTIVFCLAVANALACIGTALRAVGLLRTRSAHVTDAFDINKNLNDSICYDDSAVISPNASVTVIVASVIVDSFNKYTYTAGWLWTLAFAVNVCRKNHWHSRTYLLPATSWMKAYMWCCWGLPALFLVITLPLTVVHFPDKCPGRDALIAVYTVDYLPLIVVMVATPLLLVKSRRDARRIVLQSTAAMTNIHRQGLFSQSRLIVAIVSSFLVCWLPNITDACVQLGFLKKCRADSSDPYPGRAAIVVIWCVEAILNPLQGLINCALYGHICRRLTRVGFWCCCECCSSRRRRQGYRPLYG